MVIATTLQFDAIKIAALNLFIDFVNPKIYEDFIHAIIDYMYYLGLNY